MEQQNPDSVTDSSVDPNNAQPLYGDINNQIDPSAALAGMMPGQSFIPDPSMAALPILQPPMPMMVANGNSTSDVLPHVISAGTFPPHLISSDLSSYHWSQPAYTQIQMR
jgi:hypothetical protein